MNFNIILLYGSIRTKWTGVGFFACMGHVVVFELRSINYGDVTNWTLIDWTLG